MAATTEQGFAPEASNVLPAVSLRARNGARALGRMAQRFGGVSLSVAALTLLLFPFGSETTSEILCKMMVALVLGFVGAALWQAGTPVPAPQIEIDVVRREVRLVRWTQDARSILTRRRFSDLGAVDLQGNTAQFWDANDELLASVAVRNEASLRSLRLALRNEGFDI